MVRFVTLILMTIAAASGVAASAARAHPHAWVDLSVAVVFDAQGRIAGLRETWLLDEFYTAYAIQGRDADGDGVPDPDRLEALLELNLANLAEYRWFSRAWMADAEVAFAPPRDTATRMVGRRLEMAFFLPFAEPVPAAGAELTYAVFDPTYYIEVLHAEGDDAVRLAAAPPDCETRRLSPEPTPEEIAFAASLGRNEGAGDGLGILFAEKVRIRCP